MSGRIVAFMLGGLFAALAGFGVASLELAIKFPAHSFIVFLIVPLGAIGIGFIGSFGHYLAMKYIGIRFLNADILSIVGLSAITHLAIEYKYYLRAAPAGFQSFGDYIYNLTSLIKGTSLSDFSDIDQQLGGIGYLAGWGYPYEVLIFVGFSIGGILLFAFLTGRSFCKNCRIYRVNQGKQERYSDNIEQVHYWWRDIRSNTDIGEKMRIFESLFANRKPEKWDVSAIRLEKFICSRCSSQEHIYQVWHRAGDNWEVDYDFIHVVVAPSQSNKG